MKQLKVIKIGGQLIDDKANLEAFLRDLATLTGLKILVHGGGTLATKLAKRLGIPVKMKDGRRITNKETLALTTMVYAGDINKTIVAKLQANNCNAMGLSGTDANTILAKKRLIDEIDYGYVGDVKCINTKTIDLLLKNDITPVFCAITHNGEGQLLNTNADTIAAELAVAFAKTYQTNLYYCFEKSGVLRNINDNSSIINHINLKDYNELINKGIITKGMLPKTTNCFYALNNKVHKVCIGNTDMLFKPSQPHTTLTI